LQKYGLPVNGVAADWPGQPLGDFAGYFSNSRLNPQTEWSCLTALRLAVSACFKVGKPFHAALSRQRRDMTLGKKLGTDLHAL